MIDFAKAQRAIFLVSTPLQVVNALEARRTLLPQDCSAELVVLKKSEGSDLVQSTANNIAATAFENIEIFSLEHPGSIFPLHKLLMSLLRNRRKLFNVMQPRCRSADVVFVGNVMNREMLVAAIDAASKVVVLDDGTSTAAYLEARNAAGKSTNLGLEFSGGPLQRVIKAIVSRLAYGKYSITLSEPVFFTTYKELAVSTGCDVIHNNYEFMRASNAASRVADRVDFLGGPFVDRGDATLADYLEWLSSAHSNLGLPIRYIAHWAESDRVLSAIRLQLGINCVRLNGPYEMEFVTASSKPAVVATWFCSAFDVLPAIAGEGIRFEAYRVPFESFVNESTRLSAQGFYNRHFKADSGVRVLAI